MSQPRERMLIEGVYPDAKAAPARGLRIGATVHQHATRDELSRDALGHLA